MINKYLIIILLLLITLISSCKDASQKTINETEENSQTNVKSRNSDNSNQSLIKAYVSGNNVRIRTSPFIRDDNIIDSYAWAFASKHQLDGAAKQYCDENIKRNFIFLFL